MYGYNFIDPFENENGATTHNQNLSSIFSVKSCGWIDRHTIRIVVPSVIYVLQKYF